MRLESSFLLDLTSCGEPDWYALQVDAAHVVTADVIFNFAEVDLDLELYHPDGQLVASSDGLLMIESVSVPAAAAGLYRLQVLSADGRTGGYVLEWSTYPWDEPPPDPPPPDPPPPAGDCTDALEPNDSLEVAAPVDDQSYSGLRICEQDADWFTLRLLDPGPVIVELLPAPDAGDLDLSAFDETGRRIAVSDNGPGEREELSGDSLAAGRYYFLVEGFEGATGGYELGVLY